MEKPVCLAVVQDVDNHFYSFYEKQSFVDFCKTHSIDDKILAILQGGSDKILTVETAVEAEWML